ncbi:MAG: beta-glycosidase, partial [Sphingobacteriaceae bacterium]
LDSILSARKISAKIITPEAGVLTALYEGKGQASRQIQNLYGKNSKYYVGNLKHVQQIIAGHSYFTDAGDSTILNVRNSLRDTAAAYKIPFWQSEYSMLGSGYKEGAKGKISGMDCALFLSKIIYHDLVIANASAWQLWNAWEPGNADFDTRYYLLALKTNAENTEGDFAITKNLWALGSYSRFIRPGMQRIITARNDSLTDLQVAQNVMLSAFADQKKVVAVAVNYTKSSQNIDLKITGINKAKTITQYLTTEQAEDNMRPIKLNSVKKIRLQPRSIVTIVIEKQ